MVMICPYCDAEINEKMIENEDGCCPECGAVITANTVNYEDEEDDEFEDEFDDEFGDREDDMYEEEYGEGEFSDDDYDDK